MRHLKDWPIAIVLYLLFNQYTDRPKRKHKPGKRSVSEGERRRSLSERTNRTIRSTKDIRGSCIPPENRKSLSRKHSAAAVMSTTASSANGSRHLKKKKDIELCGAMQRTAAAESRPRNVMAEGSGRHCPAVQCPYAAGRL